MSEANKALIRRLFEEVWNQKNLALLDEMLVPDYVGDYPCGPTITRAEQLQQLIIATRAAFPDIHWRVDDLIAEGDRVVARWRTHGTHRGDWRGIPATQQPVTMRGMSIFRIVDAKIREGWGSADTLGAMRQMSIFPELTVIE